ncbi:MULTISPECIES: NAD(P)H-dependent oxidoreductase [Paenibacillus]|uniref:NAD(P)H-dependent oxidoreductase n=1 Tax=Paenibacillus polymyxa TaxID=1406 RepID=A0AAP4A0W6_PAEPO|nr:MULTISPECIES: NAD(P)H-dependent oxidoreductase [Paenibacillus]MDH2332596.1 NAD(P)H-dependent oxidoreductase [Paenibacillus polymyxa]SFR25169.1 NAD(P)H dehydrogenase (quinone) [Paenibacillus sp. cl130]
MNINILYGHPYAKSFNKAILEQVIAHLNVRGANVKVKDLIQMSFNPMVGLKDLEAKVTNALPEEIVKEQEDLLWADALIIISPVWWGGFPAVIKGYIDRVFTTGLIRSSDGVYGLEGKRAYSIFTTGSSEDYIRISRQKDMLYAANDNLFGFAKFSDAEIKLLYSVPRVTLEERKAMLLDVNRFVDRIFDMRPGEGGSTRDSLSLQALEHDLASH